MAKQSGGRTGLMAGLLSRIGVTHGGLPDLIGRLASFGPAKPVRMEPTDKGQTDASESARSAKPAVRPSGSADKKADGTSTKDKSDGRDNGPDKDSRKRRNTMGKRKRNGKDRGRTRIGFISRVDYPVEGFRTALLEKAKERFADANVHFVVLAAGLISARAVKDIVQGIKAIQRAIKRQITKLTKAFKAREKHRKELDNADFARYSKAQGVRKDALETLKKLPDDASEEQRKEAEEAFNKADAEMNKRWSLYRANQVRRANESAEEGFALEEQVKHLKDAIAEQDRELEKWKPESLAAYMAKVMPHFTNRAGKPVRLYIVPSSAFDNEIGIETARILAERRKDVILYSKNLDRFPLRDEERRLEKTLEVLVPQQQAWMRGKYDATPVQRILTDRDGLKLEDPDIFVIGGFGSAMAKPLGEFPTPWVSLPALHDIELSGVKTSENQIGVAVVSVHPDHAVPLVTFYSLKDMIAYERQSIGYPRDATPEQRRLIDVMKDLGEASTGTLSRSTGLTEDEVTVEMQSLVATPSHARNTTWPGVVWDDKSRKWKFPLRWLQEKLRYPEPDGEPKTDTVVAYGCIHGGSTNLDPDYVLRELPRRILDHGATILVGAGDFVEGLEHNLAQRGEVHPAFWNLSLQEEFTGLLIGKVTIDVFRARFPAALEKLRERTGGRQPTDEEIHAAINEALLQNLLIEGNHDEWAKKHGVTPLITMRSTMVKLIRNTVELELDKHGMRTVGLDDLVERKTLILEDGNFTLPSGLEMTIAHPHMSRTLTTSIRAQAGLKQYGKSHLVILANFHVGIAVHRWDSQRGQRACLQVGTFMLSTDFERKKQKTVDHGFGVIIMTSVNGRVVETETTFYGYRPGEGKGLDPKDPFRLMLGEFGLDKV